MWGLDVGRSQAVWPRRFLPLAAGVYSMMVEQGQEERCSGCSSAAAAPRLTCFMAADSRVSCRHDAPSASAPEQGGMAGQGQDPWDPQQVTLMCLMGQSAG